MQRATLEAMMEVRRETLQKAFGSSSLSRTPTTSVRGGLASDSDEDSADGSDSEEADAATPHNTLPSSPSKAMRPGSGRPPPASKSMPRRSKLAACMKERLRNQQACKGFTEAGGLACNGPGMHHRCREEYAFLQQKPQGKRNMRRPSLTKLLRTSSVGLVRSSAIASAPVPAQTALLPEAACRGSQSHCITANPEHTSTNLCQTGQGAGREGGLGGGIARILDLESQVEVLEAEIIDMQVRVQTKVLVRLVPSL
eukprot:scaffold99736_cov18-Tisochrysis_lutea.AAC.2